jgi:hypothetical protein
VATPAVGISGTWLICHESSAELDHEMQETLRDCEAVEVTCEYMPSTQWIPRPCLPGCIPWA